MVGMQVDGKTKHRLSAAGRKVFAEHGLKNATVREICTLADANVASVSYHFGSKERLYIHVLEEYLRQSEERYPIDAGVTPQSPAEDRLRAYVRAFLLQILGDGDPDNERLGKLLLQEIIEPSPFFQEIFEKHCMASHNKLIDIVRDLLPGVDELTVARCASSISGQCLLFDFAKEAMSLMSPDLTLKSSNMDSILETIMEFSLGGIERLRARHLSANKA
jgi:AcrR family transcriptional regulator